MSIDEAKSDLITEIHRIKREKPQATPRTIFIDLRHAYDSVPRADLYQLLDDKKILDKDELAALKWIHSNLYISTGQGQKAYTNIGVPQGLRTSPMLFNIYIDQLVKQLNETEVRSILFADDIAIVAENNHQMRRAIERL